jgi:hypothetical protein
MWVVLLVISAVAGSILAGESDSTGSGNSDGVDQGGQKCGGCQRARKWYDSLPRWKKAAYGGWFAYKKVQCNASACAF